MEIVDILENLDKLHTKILKSNLSEKITENEMLALTECKTILDKEIPKKPILKGVVDKWYYCPCCDDLLCAEFDFSYEKRQKCCHWCGQLLDWGEN